MKFRLFFGIAMIFVTLSACIIKPPAQAVDPLSPLIGQMQQGLVETRPNWPGQLNLADILPGEFLYKVGQDYSLEILVLTAPYNNEENECEFNSIYWRDNKPVGKFANKNYCDDNGLTQYTGLLHGWNKYNHLIKSERAPLTTAQLDALMEQLIPEPGFQNPWTNRKL